MNYIGIRGHRGSGKSSISYLLGNTLEYIHKIGDPELTANLFENQYNSWCDQLMIDENCINSIALDYVYFDSFSDSIKAFIRLMLGCPEEYVYENKYKDLVVINLKDLSYKLLSDFETPIKLKTAIDIYKTMPFDPSEKPIKLDKDRYMLLGEFIMYFGFDVMQRFFGKNIWVKILQASSEEYGRFCDIQNKTYYKIFSDLKTSAEFNFIKNSNGLVINIIRPGNKKDKSKFHEELSGDNKYDYNMVIDGDLYSIKNKIINLAKSINDKFKQK